MDYFSYTLDFTDDSPAWRENLDLWRFAQSAIPEYIKMSSTPEFGPPRRGFQMGIKGEDGTYMWVNYSGYVLVEHTGQGCDDLENRGILTGVIRRFADRSTRIDIAVDILCDVMPADFVAAISPDSKPIQASGHQTSKSGETFYLGSRKSDRPTKVYRYFPPHPRSTFLRVEYTFKKQQAKRVAEMLASGVSASEIAVASGKRYGWQHMCYQPDERTDLEIEAWRPERREGKTVRWLYAQALPAIARLTKSGALDLDDFIQRIKEQSAHATPTD